MRWLAWLLFSAAAFGQSPETLAAQKERALGQSLASDFERHSKMLNDAVVTAYVQELAANLSTGSSLSVAVKVVDSPERRAAAFPGGFLYVSTGLIASAKSEAEFAELVAHQLAHIVNQQGRAVVFAGDSGLCDRFGSALGPSAGQGSLELEADRLAAQYTAGFRATGAEFQQMQARLPVRRPPSLRDSN